MSLSKEQDDELCTKFPLLYRDRNSRNSCMLFGFDVGPGWFNLVYRASEKLEALIAAKPKDEQPKYRAVQVKEKLSGLRFYLSCLDDEMNQVIKEAAAEADRTCESCGQPGSYRDDLGWFQTLCDGHHHEALERKNARMAK